ncbi:outer membrane OprD family porin [Gibbsiella quercinecans]|uniref:Chitoporin n=1 Tax=Gibbsiella quercinecans TaxID=929813 RepID=A0A250AY03_9GAMM|nr:chitoporin [Gibbsiella quercinecans]RLM12064.1 chitoporin [Gibbsiella quercinecans]RLM15099.1 chitoporin [Gibbsiella quercinecans]TCT91614.1 outer membrane OprD family porin [Gibbsiella quercinecans]
MKQQDVRRRALVLVLASAAAGGDWVAPASVQAAGFIDDASLTGGVYYWQRQRDRKDVTDGDQYKTNLSHATWNANLDFSSGYAADMFGIDLALFTAVEMAESSASGHPNEIAFSSKNRTYAEDYSGDKSGVSLYKAAAKFKSGPLWARAGYIQPSGQTLLAPHWSLLPGTYQGAEAGAEFDYGDAGELRFSYMWANKYKAPWHTEMDDFRQNDRKTSVAYLHSFGAKYDFKNNLVLEAAFGQAQGYVNQYFTKASYQFSVAGNPLTTSYQFYGAEDRIGNKSDANSIYDGLAWLQALTFGYTTGPFNWRLEGTMVKAEGNQGYFLQRMTPTYASSNGRLDIWWDNRSDFNANGEKAVYAGVMYDLKNWDLPGWAVGGSYVYAWDAKPSTNPVYDQSQRLKESAYSLDAMYTVQEGRAKGTQFKLHFTRYDNHSDIPSWSGGYGNIFQDEKDVKFMVIAPFTLL